jgi:PAS domain S-box-containing protein
MKSKNNQEAKINPRAAQSALYFFFGNLSLLLLTYLCFRLDVASITVSLLFLIVIVLVSLKTAFVWAAVVSVIAYLLLDTFFTAPLFRPAMSETLDMVAPAAFLTTSYVITRLMAHSRRAFEEIRGLRDQLRLVIDTVPGFVWSAMPDGSPEFLNRRWLEYTGLSPEEGLDWGEKIAAHPEDRAKLLNDWKKSFTSGNPIETEARLRRADGEYRWLMIRALPLRDDAGNIIKWYGTNTDIDDRKRAEEALRRSQAELAHVTRVLTMGEMASSIAHEINQPLSAVVTNGAACLRWLEADPPNLDEARQTASRIVRDGNRAGDVIKRIRSFLRKTDVRKIRFDIRLIVNETTKLMANEAAANKTALRIEFSDDLPSALGDPVQIQQVVLNLIKNAFEAMSGQCESERELFISGKTTGGSMIAVEVSDTGPGVKAEDREKIFDAFYSTKQHGMGMGLGISRTIIEDHGGRLQLVASDNGGANFRFTLPAETVE